MEDDDDVDITIEDIKPSRSKSGFYGKMPDQSNTINDDVSEKLIKPKENNNKKECTLCSFNLNAWFTIINLVTGALGGGVIAFPSILRDIGMVTGMICFFIVAFSVYYSLDLLRRFVVDTKLFSYASITNATLGYFWLIMYSISSFIVYMMSIASYLHILFLISFSVIGISDDKEDKSVEKLIYFFISYIIEVLLCLFTSNLSKIHILSTICFCIFVIILLAVIIGGFINITKGNLDYATAFEIKKYNNSWEKFICIMSKINEFLVGFLSHSTFPTLLNLYKSPNDDEKTKKINKVQLIILYILYGLYTIFGLFYLGNSNDVDKNNNNKYKTKDLKTGDYIVNILLMVYIISLVPIRYLIIRDNYTSVLKKDYLPAKIEIPITCLCILICNIFASLIRNNRITDVFMNIFIAIFGVFICFILPVINFVKLNDKTKIRSIIGYIISGIFILIGIFSIIFYIIDWKKNNK